MGAYQNQRRSSSLGTRFTQHCIDRGKVVAVFHPYRMPAVGAEARRAIFRERNVGTSGQRHEIVIVQARQLAELQVAGQRCRLRTNAFHQVAIAYYRISVMINQRMPGSVVTRGELRFADGHALSERPGSDLHAQRVRPRVRSDRDPPNSDCMDCV
jgi:hypothetical protein